MTRLSAARVNLLKQGTEKQGYEIPCQRMQQLLLRFQPLFFHFPPKISALKKKKAPLFSVHTLTLHTKLRRGYPAQAVIGLIVGGVGNAFLN